MVRRDLIEVFSGSPWHWKVRVETNKSRQGIDTTVEAMNKSLPQPRGVKMARMAFSPVRQQSCDGWTRKAEQIPGADL